MKVFLSSTYIDLIDHRESATMVLEKLRQQVERMEILNAGPNEPTKAAFDELKQCDLFIGIYAYRYGTISPHNELSITELEYDYAKELKIPQFCFLLENTFPWNPEMMQSGVKTKLNKFKKKIKNDLVVGFFTTPEDLASKISTSIVSFLTNPVERKSKGEKESSKYDLTKIKEFEKNYRNQVGNFNKLITIPHFDKAPRINIDKIFVPPDLIKRFKKRDELQKDVSFSEFLNSINRTVVIGDPGAGKSTLAQKICFELCNNYEKRVINNKLLTPVIIVLRDYSSMKKDKSYSILQFIETEATSKYQLPKPPPENTFEFLLKKGQIIAIFDGLDELLDTSNRRKITNDIESFCNIFPDSPVIITSRVVGYEQAPLDSEIFETFLIAPFSDNQIELYVDKWFNNRETACRGDPDKNRDAFLKESEVAPDLRSNPLMLALMCNLYRGAGFIPRNRPDLYKKCSEMLFERWDPSRGIWSHFPISEPRALLSHLAYWIYTDESLQSGISETQLIKKATKFLYPRRFETEEEAEQASKDFINFCRGRAWVFTDVGTTIKGENLYKFTHKTFLEYFTAVNIVRKNNSPEELWNLLESKIGERSWDVVAQLSFQILHEQIEDACDELLKNLIKSSYDKVENKWSYLSFGVRCLKFIQPNPKIVRELTEESIHGIINEDLKSKETDSDLNINADLLSGLTSSCQECRNIIADSIQRTITKYLNSDNQKEILKAIELGTGLQFGLILNSIRSDTITFWEKISDQFLSNNLDKIEKFALKDMIIFRFWARETKPDNLIKIILENFSFEHLFHSNRSRIFNIYLTSIVNVLLRYNLADIGKKKIQNYEIYKKYYVRQCSILGELVLEFEFPCISYDSQITFVPLHLMLLTKRKKPYFNPNQFFGIWACLAIYTECFKRDGEEEEILRETENLPQVFKTIILARLNKSQKITVSNSLVKNGLSEKQKEIIERWMKNKLNFLK